MAELAPAHPRDTHAARLVPAMGILSIKSMLLDRPARLLSLAVQAAAVAHLGALAVLEALPGNYSPPFFIAATGVALVLLTLRTRTGSSAPRAVAVRPVAVAASPTPDPLPAPDLATGGRLDLAGVPLSARELDLEIQSQRLVEIADAATRSRQEATRRSQAWASLMAQVSHDIRTPLNAVIGFSDVIGTELFGPIGHPRYREYVDHIRDSGRALLKSAEDTLALTQLLAQPGADPSHASAAVAPIAIEAWSVHAADATDRCIEVSLDIDPATEVLCDCRLLRQILVNLMSEALARAGDATSITIRARSDDDLVEIGLEVSGPVIARKPGEQSLSLGLARALLELQDAFLVEYPTTTDTWRVATMMTRSTQQDFFAPLGADARTG